MIKRIVKFLLCFLTLMVYAEETRRRFKRIVHGFAFRSLNGYDVRFVVSLRSAWGCAGSIEHDFDKCSSDHFCTGSLIHPIFVLTACHCSSWDEFEYTEKTGMWWFWKPYHPLYNQMIIRAGTVKNDQVDETNVGVQRRHVMSFLPHSLCNAESVKNNLAPLVMRDVALIKACEPFDITQYVRTAYKLPPPDINKQFTEVMAKGKACLWAGFGNVMEDRSYDEGTLTRWLRYMFRTFTCDRSCVRKTSPCMVCSTYVGPRGAAAGFGDSGCPVICEGKLFAVHSSSAHHLLANFSDQIDTPLYCFERSIRLENLEAMTKLLDENRNYMNNLNYGNPSAKRVNFGPAKITAHSVHHSGQLVRCRSSLILLLLSLLWSFWKYLIPCYKI